MAFSTAYRGDPAQYDRTRPFPPEVLRASLAALRPYLAPGAWVADVGAGTGRWVIPLAQEGFRAVALDLSPEMLAHLRQKAGATPPYPVRADAHALPLASAGCQALLSVHTLQLMHDLPGAVAEIARVLWPGGWFFLGYVDHLPGSVVGWAMRTWRRYLLAEGYDLNRPAWRDQEDVLPVLRQRLRHVARLTPAQWTPTVVPAQVVEGAVRRTYTLYWGLDEAGHRRLSARLIAEAQTTFGPDLTAPRPDPRRFVWEVFQKPA